MVARSVAAIGRAGAAEAEAKASAARLAASNFLMERPTSRTESFPASNAANETGETRILETAAGDPGNLAGDELLDDPGQMLVEPFLEHRPQHLAHHGFERAGIGGQLAA